MTTLEPSYDVIRIQLLCPDQRCGMELSKADIIDLLDIDTVKKYESWIRTACRDLYCLPSSDNRICCIKCKDRMAKNCSSMSSMKGKGMNNNEANQSHSTAYNDSIQCQDSWVCTNCDFSRCVACGFAFETQSKQSGCTGGHVCREATNYRINNLVTDLEVIYNEYITGTVKSDPPPGTSCDKNTTGTINSENQPSTTSFNTDSSGTPFPLSDQYGSMENIKTVWGPGTGFGGNRHEDNSTEENVRKVEKELDCQAGSVLKSLTDVLQNRAANQLQPILGFSAHVLLGQENVVGRFLEYLVTNDSMMDICGRSELYLQLADLLKTLAQYPELLMLLMGSCFQSVRKGGSIVHCNTVNDSSIIMKMKKIYEQAKIIVNRFTDGNDDINMETDFHAARCLLECYEKLSVAAEKQASVTECDLSDSGDTCSRMAEDGEVVSDQTTSVSKEEGSINMEDKVNSDHHKNVLLYKEGLKKLQFSEYPLIGAGSQGHTYSKYFDESGANPQSIDNTGVHNKKRMLYILKETASLTTSLPLEWESSIHVRVDPVRMDLLKALIVGPKGTPYQNGVFIFDIYLPPDYPQVPPQVHFLTTGCGMVRFNPNLYNSGKVCLSLLGTWDGPGWQPWRSTILQVLVSIQSLIFVADPFYNEPGNEMWTEDDDEEDKDDYGNYSACDAAEEENRSHRYNTLKIAILGALQEPDPSFKDVIITHFLHKKDEIINQCNDWRKASGGPKHPLYKKVENTANEVVAELAKVSPL
ncbi:uncharacterized protein LOC131039403 isoform X2 [Cryptomeria japonica]|nr:uncharacterized protein LOC131039403 isoform X2 [Cryptomeria japonica]